MRRWLSRLLGLVVVVLLGVGAVTALLGTHPVASYLTHWKGSPTHTVAYGPYPVAGTPIVRIAVAGDIGDSGKRLTETADAIRDLSGVRGWDDLLILGDNVYPRGDPERLPKTVFEPFAPVLHAGTQLLAILGNHDVKDGNGPRQMAALGMPGLWWSTETKGVLIVGLDSNEIDNATQRAWLERTLRESTAPWKIVALHHPPYSAGYQGSSKHERDVFSPLFERYDVQLVLSGHDHDYQRSKVINGVTYVVSGAAAGTRRTGTASFTARSFSWHHFVEVSVFADQLVVRAINESDRVADEDVIQR